MQKYNLNVLIEYDDSSFCPKVLINEPNYRMVLLSMRAGQCIPAHATSGTVTVHAIIGHITIFAGPFPDELYAGEVICIESGRQHSIEAHEDSALLVLSTGAARASADQPEELDLCQIPRAKRHPLVFARFDALALGESFVLVNDHNPVLLERELEHTRPGQAVWEHVDRGPEKYHVRIRRVSPSHTSHRQNVSRPEDLVHEIHSI